MEIDDFNRRLGEVLRAALHVEDGMDFFLSNYFSRPQTGRTHILQDEFAETTFNRKKELLRKICKGEELDSSTVKPIFDAITFVQETRNKVAHWEAYKIESKLSLRPRKSSWNIKEEITLTDELMKEVDEKRLFAIQGLVKINQMIEESEKKMKEKYG